MNDLFGEAVFTYTRAEALADGVLIDVSKTAEEAGFRYPVAVTQALNSIINPSEVMQSEEGQSYQGRLWDVLTMARLAAKNASSGGSDLLFKVIMPCSPSDQDIKTIKMNIGPGDSGEPVLTLMMEWED